MFFILSHRHQIDEAPEGIAGSHPLLGVWHSLTCLCVLSSIIPPFFFVQITQLSLWSHGSACERASPPRRACHGRFSCSSSCTGCSARELSLQRRRPESGSLTRLIAFDSSLSSPADQWSSALFIRNINVPQHSHRLGSEPYEPGLRAKIYFVRSRSASALTHGVFIYFYFF